MNDFSDTPQHITFQMRASDRPDGGWDIFKVEWHQEAMDWQRSYDRLAWFPQQTEAEAYLAEMRASDEKK